MGVVSFLIGLAIQGDLYGCGLSPWIDFQKVELESIIMLVIFGDPHTNIN